jgi:hypothetical protein
VNTDIAGAMERSEFFGSLARLTGTYRPVNSTSTNTNSQHIEIGDCSHTRTATATIAEAVGLSPAIREQLLIDTCARLFALAICKSSQPTFHLLTTVPPDLALDKSDWVLAAALREAPFRIDRA